MPYLGRPLISDKTTKTKKIDSIASSFNGAQTVFSLNSSGTTVYPASSRNLFVSINGVLQEPDVAYTINAATITFTSAPTTNATFFCVVNGEPNDLLLTPSVTTLTVGANVSMNTTTLLIGNSTVNTTMTATTLTVGANVSVNSTTAFVGNTTVNTAITSGGVTVNGNSPWLSQTFRGLTLRTHPDADVAASKVYLDHADEIVMHNGVRVADWDDLVANIAVNGAGGLDTGTEGASRWYSIHAIRKSSDGTKNLLLHRAKSYDLNQSDTSAAAAEGDLNYSSGVAAVAQGFTPSVTGYRPFVDFNLNKQGSPTGQMYVEIYADSGGSPTGAALAVSDKLDVSLVPTSGRIWVRFPFRSPVSLTASTQYHYVFKTTSTVSITNFLSVGASSSNSYAGGVAKRYDGAAWQTSSVGGFNAADFNFKDYVTQNDTALTMPSGYDQYCLIGWVYNNSSSDFDSFLANGCDVLYPRVSNNLMATSAATVSTLTDLSTMLPPAPILLTKVALTNATSGARVRGDVILTPNGYNGFLWMTASALSEFTDVSAMCPIEFQHIYLSVDAGTATSYLRSYRW